MAPITVSYSEIQRGRMCPHYHLRTYKQRWSKPNVSGSALDKGSMMHIVLETWYKSLMTNPGNRQAAMSSVDQVFSDFAETGKDPDTINLVRWMFEGYVEYYGTDEEWQILAVEYRFDVPLRTPAGRLSGFRLKGGVDLVGKHRPTGRRFVWDHKTAANLPKDSHDLDLHDQFGIYKMVLNLLGKNITGCLYNGLRTTRNKGDYPELVAEWLARKAAGEKPGARPVPQKIDDRFDRVLTNRTDNELATVHRELLETARFLYSKANKHTRHPDAERCKRMCSMREACLTGRKLGDDREEQFLRDTGWEVNLERH